MALAMIDSGATGNFMSRKFAMNHQIPGLPKKRPYQLTVVDGTSLNQDEEMVGLTSARLCWIAIGWHGVGHKLWDTGQGLKMDYERKNTIFDEPDPWKGPRKHNI